eukprot:scaffold4735_cov403-Prasinococcus_capsulatus_cf.AAC.9
MSQRVARAARDTAVVLHQRLPSGRGTSAAISARSAGPFIPLQRLPRQGSMLSNEGFAREPLHTAIVQIGPLDVRSRAGGQAAYVGP